MPSNKVRTRFAPSPTGYMHVGNLRTALYLSLIHISRLKVLRCEKQDYIDLAVCIACFAVILASRLVFPNF